MVTGTLLACAHCGDCIEILGEPPKPHHLDEYQCDCGAALEIVDGDDAQRAASSPSALSFDMRGG
jgi:hypothetical protein